MYLIKKVNNCNYDSIKDKSLRGKTEKNLKVGNSTSIGQSLLTFRTIAFPMRKESECHVDANSYEWSFLSPLPALSPSLSPPVSLDISWIGKSKLLFRASLRKTKYPSKLTREDILLYRSRGRLYEDSSRNGVSLQARGYLLSYTRIWGYVITRGKSASRWRKDTRPEGSRRNWLDFVDSSLD